jgi:hypothetical protein
VTLVSQAWRWPLGSAATGPRPLLSQSSDFRAPLSVCLVALCGERWCDLAGGCWQRPSRVSREAALRPQNEVHFADEKVGRIPSASPPSTQ